MPKMTVTTTTGEKHVTIQTYEWLDSFRTALEKTVTGDFISFENTERETVNIQRQHIVSIVAK